MAKRRKLKKVINLMSEELMTELVAASQAHTNVPAADLENIAQSILLMQDDFISRLSHVDKTQVRRFFQQLTEDLSVSANEIIDNIYHLS